MRGSKKVVWESIGMSHVMICREAVEDSVLGNLALARAFSRKGQEVTVVFTGEALYALDKGTFQWSRNFKTRAVQAEIVAATEGAGLSLAHPDLDNRWSDIRSLVVSMSDAPDIQVIACPIW